MAQQSVEPIAAKALEKPERVKVNIATNEGKHLKMNIKISWTVHQLKEHLYDYNYFPQPPFNQIISLHGSDLANTQTFEEIYDAIQNKGTQSVLHSLRGKLTWEADDEDKKGIGKLAKDNDDNVDDDASKQAMSADAPNIPEISLYIRSKRTPKRKLHTLTSDEPVIQEFIASHERRSITIKSPLPSDHDASSSDDSSSSHVGGYKATTFDPEAMRRKQEKKALKKLYSPVISSAIPESPQIKFIEQEELEPKHAPSASVIFHQLDEDDLSDEESSDESSGSQSIRRSISPQDNGSSSTSASKHSQSSPVHIDEEAATDEKEEKSQTEPIKKTKSKSARKRIKKKHSARLSLYADISEKLLSAQSRDSDSDNADAEQTPLTQENLYMHETAQQDPITGGYHARRRSKMSSLGSWAGSGGSMDWGGGPFIVRRMSVGSASGLPSNLGFYHAANASTHLWELDLPEYYDMPDSLQRIHSKLEKKGAAKHSRTYIEPVDEHNVLETKEENVEPPALVKKESSVRFSEKVVYKSEEEEEEKKKEEEIVADEEEKEKEKKEDDIEHKLDVENVSKWKIKQIGVDDKYVAGIDRIKGENKNKDEDDDDASSDSTDSKLSQDSDRHQIEVNVTESDSDETESDLTSRSNEVYDEAVVKRDKLQEELTWKTSYLGIWLIGCVWFGAFHCLYSFSAIVNNVVSTLNVKLFEFGLMYSFNFIGVGIGLFISSYLLNKPRWMNSSHTVAKHSIFIVFICQSIATLIFLYEYVIDSDSSPDALLWFILVLSFGVMGVAIGFVESSVNNLVFEWFSNDAFSAKLSALHGNAHTHLTQKQYLATLSTRVLSYCMFFKEFGHISARLFLVPMIYLTFSDNTNLFVPLLFGVIVAGCGWCGLIYASYRDNKCKSSYQQVRDKEDDDVELFDAASDNDSESTPLLPPIQHTKSDNLIQRRAIPEDWSYSDWYQMELVGLNQSVLLSIIFLSMNFGVSFSFTILSIPNLCQQYGFTDYTANLLICCIPIATLFGSNWLRLHVLSKINSIWTVMFIGSALYVILFALLAFAGVSDITSVWLPIVCVLLFIFASECAFASGYELLLSSAPEYIHGLISGLNSTTNFIISGLCILIFSVLVIDYSTDGLYLEEVHQYRWAYAFCCAISLINFGIAIKLRYSFGANVDALHNMDSK